MGKDKNEEPLEKTLLESLVRLHLTTTNALKLDLKRNPPERIGLDSYG